MKSKKLDINNWSVKSLLIILFFLLISVVVLWKFVLPQKASAAWWNDGWNYRKAVSIGNTGSSTTNQYVKITLDTASLISAGKIKNTCDDIRVTNINGKLLPHFIDGNASFACNTSTTSIYVLIDSIPSSGSTVYIYYGNPSAVNVEPQLGTQQNPAISCKNILQHRSDNKGTQQYYITPTGNLADSIQVTCDMTYSSGGWIQVWHGLPTEAFVNDATHETVNLSNNIIFNEMRVEGTNLNFNVVDTVTQTAMLGSSIGTYFKQVNDASDATSPTVSFHTLTGVQSVKLTNNYFMYGYGNDWRFFYSCVDVESIDYIYLGGCSPGVPPRNTFNSLSVGCGGGGNNDYCGNARTTTPKDTGLNLSLYQYQESSVYVRETAITLNISQSMGTIATEEAGGGPIAYWKFDEGNSATAYDSTTNNHNGALQNGTAWASEDQCVSGKCLKFDGVNDYVNAGTGDNYFPMQTFSMCAWAKSPGLASGMTTNGIMSLTYGLSMSLNSSGQLWSYIDNGSSFTQITATSNNLHDNKFHFLCLTYDGTNGNLYIDGTLKKSAAAGWLGTTRWPTNGVNIGHENNNSAIYKFNGWIDEPKIYRYTRTAAQIKLDYNAGKAHASTSKGTSTSLGSNKNNGDLSDGLVGYWKMDENTGTSITDSSGLGNTGTFGTGDSSPAWSSGKYGIGISFATNQYVQISSIVDTTIKSYSYWIYQTSAAGSQAALTSNNLYHMASYGGVNDLSTLFPDDQKRKCTSTIPLNVWSFVYLDLINDKIYLNGIDCTQTAVMGWGHDPFTGLIIGKSYINYGAPLGKIDEIRAYNRALSPGEVSQLYEYAPGPITYYDFNEASGTTAYDKSGNNKNGTLQSSPTWIQGKYGGALDFNASGQKVVIGTTTPISGQATATLWYKRTNTASTTWRTLLGDANNNIHHLISNSASRNLGIWDGSFRDFGYNPPDDNQFHNYAVIYDVGSSATLYVDGVYKNKIYTTLNLVTNPISSIGNGNSSGYWVGSIDDVKIYNYARTQKQIIEDMTGGAPATSSKSIIAYYKFDEGQGTVANNFGVGGTSLNSIFGTGNSAPTWTNDGKFNKALSFNGVNNYIQGSSSSLLKPTNITISAWAKTSDSKSTQFIGGYGNTGVLGYWLGAGSSQFVFSVGNGSSNKQLSSNFTSNDNNWHHIVGTYDGSTQKIFIDGNLKNTSTTVTGDLSYGTLTNGFLIGNAEGLNSARFWSGFIDELKVYNYALTPDEIKQDYNQGSAISFGSSSQTIGNTTTSLEYCIPGDTSPCASPIAEYKFDEGVGTSAFDTSGSNNHGAIGSGSSAPSWVQGKIGKALSFDGASARLPLNTSINLNGNADWTVSTWVKTTYTGSNPILSNRSGGPVYNDLRVLNSKMSYYHYNGSWINETGNKNVADGKWHYLTWVNHNNQTMDMYIDGVGDTMGVSSALSSSGPVDQIGRDWSVSSLASIDQVRIYNYARTPAQIAYDYNKGGPIGWWKLDECQGNIAYDWSGIGNTGTIVIGASGTQNSLGTCQSGTAAAWTNGAIGKLNSSLNFDGVDDTVDVNNINYPSTWTDAFSLSTWIFIPSSASWDNGYISNIVSRGSYTGSHGLVKNNVNNQVRMFIRGDNGSISVIGTITRDKWYHLSGTWDGTTIKLYINGIFIGESGSVRTGSPGITPLYIGRARSFSGAGGSWFDGQIDDVRVYNYALTSEQIKTLYNGGAVSFN